MFGKIGLCEPESYILSNGFLGTNFSMVHISKKNKKIGIKSKTFFIGPIFKSGVRIGIEWSIGMGGNLKITNLSDV